MEEVKRSLAGTRRQLTLRLKALQQAIDAQDAQSIESRLPMLIDTKRALEKLDLKMSDLLEEESEAEGGSDKAAQEECEKAFLYQDQANLCMLKANTWLNNFKTRSGDLTCTGMREPQVKLEKLSLPSFDGDILAFRSFWETFHSRVDSNPTLNNIDKFDYLLSRCKGQAADAIAVIPRTSSGYELAVRTLQRRFGRRAPIIDLCLTQLIEIKPLGEECSTSELRKALDLMNVHVRTLLSLGLDEKGGADWLGPVLVARLPGRLRLKWEEITRKDYGEDSGGLCPDLEEFLDFFHKMVEMEEAVHGASLERQKIPIKDKRYHVRASSPKPSRKLTLSSSFNTHAAPFKCQLCRGNDHCLWKCPQFLKSSFVERKRICRQFFLCFNCLSTGHSVADCSTSSRCRHCQGKHHTLLHVNNQNSGATSAKPGTFDSSGEIASNASMSLPCVETNTRVLLQSCKAHAKGPRGNREVIRVLFDSCSNYSFVRKSTAERLQLSEQNTLPLTVHTFGCNVVQRNFPVCSINLSPLVGGPSKVIDVVVTDHLVHPIQGHQIDLSRYQHLKSLSIPEDYSSYSPMGIDVLIGANHYHDFVLHKLKRGSRNEPIAVKTVLGWTLHGPYSDLHHLPQKPDPSISLFCDIRSASRPSLSDDLEKLWALEAINIPYEPDAEWVEPRFKKDRISTRLPWKASERPLSNEAVVMQRQVKTDSRLNPSQKEKLHTYFDELKELKIIEPCSEKDPKQSWYLPHHCVWHKKLRVVFDGSFGRPSLNEHLMTGPNLLTVIPICLTSYRLFEFPVVADIEKAFLQIDIEEQERDFLRFFIDRHAFRFCRVPFGLSCSPALLNSGLKLLYDSSEEHFPETTNRLRHCTYVDDVVTSFPDKNSLLEFKSQSIELFSQASMNLRGWTSEPEKVLGVAYDCVFDELRLPLNQHPIFSSASGTRRAVLSYTSSLFDPLGLWIPWIIRLRLFLQSTWKEGLAWDDGFSPALEAKWQELLTEASRQREFRHSRCLKLDESLCELHAFADASQKAYATCLYVRSSSGARLMYARGRVNPLKPELTTPRAELLAAVLASRAVALLKRNLPMLSSAPTFFWSDSTCVLSWLKGDQSKLKLFVRNRVSDILQVEGEWRYVPTGDNPADMASRGVSAAVLSSSQLWEKGPEWLADPASWPEQPASLGDQSAISAAVTCTSDESPTDPFPSLLLRASTLSRFVRIVAWITRFIGNCSKSGERCSNKVLSNAELEVALHRSIQHEQGIHFPAEIEALKENLPVPKNSPLSPLRPSWDAKRQLLVTTPRTNESPKIMLPRSSRLTHIIIFDIHVRSAHVGVDHSLANFQALYWTSRARLLVKGITRECLRCLRFRPRLYGDNEGSLPDFRSEISHPFENVGLDHAGPLYLQDGSKVYVLLFTCACVRAVHLELVSSLSAEDTALAFRRFQARRGVPLRVFSDNAKCFKRVAPALGLTWSFIPERSPSWGGWWERMIQCVKRALRKVVGRTSLTYTELATVLLEIEGHINERPLTYVSDDADSVTPLTPAHFLNIKQPLGTPWVSLSSEVLTRRWRHQCKIVADLKSRWQSEYLPTLRQWRGRNSTGPNPQVGDVVLVPEGSRATWPLGRITALHPGRDGKVRVVTICLRGKLTRRLTRLIYPLECGASS